MRVHLLGGFRVTIGERTLPDSTWRRRKARQLFKCLLTRPHRRLTKDEALELFWPESDPEAAAINLRSTVHAMRVALEAGEAGAGSLVVVDRDGVGLRADVSIWVDADAFEQNLALAQHSPDPLPLLEEARALYAGDYLPDDPYEDWAAPRRESLRRAWVDAHLWLAREREQRGEPEAAATELQRLLDVDSCNEGAAQMLMQLLLRQGGRAEALRVFQRLEKSLAEELGVEPSAGTRDLQRVALEGRDSTTLRPAAAFRCAYPFPSPAELVGREQELQRLTHALERARTSSQMVLIGAPAGTGKSTLVGALVRRAQLANVLCLAGGCYEGAAVLLLGPFHDALADYLLATGPDAVRDEIIVGVPDLAAVVPELRDRLGAVDEPTASTDRGRLFAAVLACLRRLAERGPVVLCLEDLHAADAATLHLVHYLARQARRLPLMLVATYRTEEARSGQPLQQAIAALLRERLAEQLYLDALDRDQSSRLLAGVLGDRASDSLCETLHTISEGTPLFLEHLALALRESGHIVQRAGVWRETGSWETRPPTVPREVIGQRLERLDPATRDTLAVAAVLGPAVEHQVLVAALEPQPESEILVQLEQVLEAQLLRETPTGYAFAHGLLQQAVYWGLSGPRRMLLHARSGETLERLAGDRAAERASELAYHFSVAGSALATRAKALRYNLEAGRRAAALSSDAEALHHFGRACDLLDRHTDLGDPETRLVALEGRGLAERHLGMWLPSIASYRRVLEASADPIRRALARDAIAAALQHTGDVEAVVAEADAGLAELERLDGGAEAAAARVQIQYNKALLLYFQGQFSAVLELGELMLRDAEGSGRDEPRYLAHSVLGWGCMGSGDIDQAIAQHEQALAAAERAAFKIGVAIARENLGMLSLLGGTLDAAHAHLDEAIRVFRDAARESRAMYALVILGRVWLAEGDLDKARELGELAYSVAMEERDRREAQCHDLLGAVYALRSEYDLAEGHFQRALALHREVGHLSGQVETLNGLGAIEQRRGNLEAAEELYRRALGVAATMEPGPHLIAALRRLGRLRLRLGDDTEAAELIQRAFALAEQHPRSIEYAPTLLGMAELALRRQDPSGATDLAERALQSASVVETKQDIQAFLALVAERGSAGAGALEADK